MVRVVRKKLYKGKKIEIGKGQHRGLVFIVDKKGKILDTLTTKKAKEIGFVKASKKKKSQYSMFGF